jgi:hypothetical protein
MKGFVHPCFFFRGMNLEVFLWSVFVNEVML